MSFFTSQPLWFWCSFRSLPVLPKVLNPNFGWSIRWSGKRTFSLPTLADQQKSSFENFLGEFVKIWWNGKPNAKYFTLRNLLHLKINQTIQHLEILNQNFFEACSPMRSAFGLLSVCSNLILRPCETSNLICKAFNFEIFTGISRSKFQEINHMLRISQGMPPDTAEVRLRALKDKLKIFR